MKRPGFMEGVVVALVLGIAGSISYTGLDWFMTGRHALQTIVSGVSLIYLIYLLRRSRERIGRVTVCGGWLLLTACLWLMQPPLMIFAICQAGVLWLVRSLYHYTSVLSALADMLLTGFALAAAVWGGDLTGSLLFALWCFFLVSALFVTIPPDWHKTGVTTRPDEPSVDRFERAHLCAVAAVQKLSN